MVKKDVWKGVDEDSIEKLAMEDFLKKATSRERRTIVRALANKNRRYKTLIERVREIKKENPKKVIRTHMRAAVILPEWVGLTFGIHNGKEFRKIEITVKKVGKRLGDFAHTTGRVAHSGPGVGATRGSKFVPLK
jgi:small subunit ribosomal protein S19